jgi:hypothetical protein
LKLEYTWPDGVIAGTPVTPEYSGGGDHAALTVWDPVHTRNVAVPDGDHLRRITHESDQQLANVELGPVRVVQWKSKEGIALEGIATFPAGYVEGRKYPFLVLPHGGPEANDELSFDFLSRIIAGPLRRSSARVPRINRLRSRFSGRDLPAFRRPGLRRCR